jgi:uncharacterized protein (UPF0335 family)
MIEIGQRMYTHVFRNIKLLYANSTHNFRFEEEKYEVEHINPLKKIFREKNDCGEMGTVGKECIVLERRISKVGEQSDAVLQQYLRSYKN